MKLYWTCPQCHGYFEDDQYALAETHLCSKVKQVKHDINFLQKTAQYRLGNGCLNLKRLTGVTKRRFDAAVYRLQHHADICPFVLSNISKVSVQSIQKIVGEVFQNQCLMAEQCWAKPFLSSLRDNV